MKSEFVVIADQHATVVPFPDAFTARHTIKAEGTKREEVSDPLASFGRGTLKRSELVVGLGEWWLGRHAYRKVHGSYILSESDNVIALV